MANSTILAHLAIMLINICMAAKTSGGSTLEDSIDMALGAGSTAMSTRQLETCLIMIKCGGFPGSGGMAQLATLPHAALVSIIFGVTSKTSRGRAFEHIVDMASLAGHICMRASQFESRQIMIKTGGAPCGSSVAGFAILSQASIMMVIFGMTAKTSRGSAFEHVVDMASLAGHICMCTGQFESRQIMVKAGRFPGLGDMTGFTILSQASFMRVIFGMATKTSRGSALINIIYMAGFTLNIGMFTSQFESSQVVVKRSGLPTLDRMANTTFFSKCALMCIIFLMTGKTLSRGVLVNFIHMTGDTLHPSMLSFKLEGRQIMIKTGRFPTIHLVAVRTICTKTPGMCIILKMAIAAFCRKRFEINSNVCI